MRILLFLFCLSQFALPAIAQHGFIKIADGTLQSGSPHRIDPPTANEIEYVRSQAMMVKMHYHTFANTSLNEIIYTSDFQILDAVTGSFTFDKTHYKACLYRAWNKNEKRNYQGLIVFRSLENGTKFETEAHYAYRYRGDTRLLRLPDISGNSVAEIAIFSENYSRIISSRSVRIIELSGIRLRKFGTAEIYNSEKQKQRMPYRSGNTGAVKFTYIPSIATAIRLFVNLKADEKPAFFIEEFRQRGDNWIKQTEISPFELKPDNGSYFEIKMPDFPKIEVGNNNL